ncbi:hypothetical protein [Shumkonia mesophila]|uniref:hypothetical protein n=1 Tax=Shumkonia mesophila TaxID=2838854 RepID=UPI0029346344|nr:hypothetical protein [Shumkonia mesophila]
MKLGFVVAALAAVLVAGCASSGETRKAGTFLNPWCAPDGSVVYTQYANSKGEFDGAKASAENCPWYKK